MRNPKKKRSTIANDPDMACSPGVQEELAALLDVRPGRPDGAQAPERVTELADVEVILSNWGRPRLDAPFLAALPGREAIRAAPARRPPADT